MNMAAIEHELAKVGVDGHNQTIVCAEVERAVAALRSLARMATEQADKLDTDNGASALNSLRYVVDHAGYSNTIFTAATEAATHLAQAQGMLIGSLVAAS